MRTQRPLIDRLMNPLRRFMAIQAASGVILVLAAGVALTVANSPWSDKWAAFWHTHLPVSVGAWVLDESLLHWINDGLMTIFFFVVGLEIKREIIDGELREPRKAALPLMAALGGMVVPAALYLFLVGDDASAKPGWGIPMATDIAFVVGFLALLGTRVPAGLKIVLLALAIVDDIGAILVIAVFYSAGVSASALSLACAGFVLALLCRWLDVRSVGVYVAIGVAIWLAMFHSGIHPTVAGVLLGLMTPAKPALHSPALLDELTAAVLCLPEDDDRSDVHSHMTSVGRLKAAVVETVAPLERLETILHPWVAFLIMPLFALANAGVQLQPTAVTHPVAMSVAGSLVVGKPVGILLFSALAVRLGLAKLPAGVNWKVITGAGCLAGIGFTMSLFIASLALEGHLLSAAKIGTMLGSAISGSLGLSLLVLFLPRRGQPSKGGRLGDLP